MPLAEHDRSGCPPGRHFAVSIHVPLAEHDILPPYVAVYMWRFQFTCPSRSTTPLRDNFIAPRYVSIHVPLAEHDDVRD